MSFFMVLDFFRNQSSSKFFSDGLFVVSWCSAKRVPVVAASAMIGVSNATDFMAL